MIHPTGTLNLLKWVYLGPDVVWGLAAAVGYRNLKSYPGNPKPSQPLPYRHDNVQAPHHRGEVESNQLPRFIELAVFDLGEMETPVDFLQRSKEKEKEQENMSHQVSKPSSISSSPSQEPSEMKAHS